jgi:DNA-directed RNA polymerase specialized sigma subunit
MEKYFKFERFLNTKIEEKFELSFSEIESIGGFKLPNSAYQYTAYWNPNGHPFATIVDMQKEIDQQTNDLMIAKRKALRLLDLLKPESEVILIKRYFENKNVIELGKILFVTRRQAQRKLTEAITAFQSILDQQGEENL